MTKLAVDYVAGATDPIEELSDDELEVERALEWARLERTARGQKEFDESQHPRDDHGRFSDGGGSSPAPAPASTDRISTPTTTAEVHSLYVKDFNAYQQELHDHGGPPPSSNPRFSAEGVYQGMNVDRADPEDVSDEERARCEEAAAKFLNDPAMQPLFDEYGRPGIVVANNLVSPDDQAGSDPRDASVVAQWSNGTIFLYGDTAGDPTVDSTPGFSVSGTDPFISMQHEYGHQIMGVIGYDSNGDMSDFRESFIQALGDGVPFNDHMTPQQQDDFSANVKVETGQVSEYAQESPDEAFAEFFATMLSEGSTFSVDNFDGGAAEAFRLIQDRIAKDTNQDQQTLFSRANP